MVMGNRIAPNHSLAIGRQGFVSRMVGSGSVKSEIMNPIRATIRMTPPRAIPPAVQITFISPDSQVQRESTSLILREEILFARNPEPRPWFFSWHAMQRNQAMKRIIETLAAVVFLTGQLVAAAPSADEISFFESKIRPLLSEHCYDCHSTKSEKIKGGLVLDSRDGWMAGGDSGDVIEPGSPNDSLLLTTVSYADPDLQMPPKYKLKDEEIELLEEWIAMGAPDPRSGPATVKTYGVDLEKGRQHWAFKPVSDPAAPVVKDGTWPRNDVDRFTLSRMETAGIHPVPDADRFSLLRRVSLDLTGLPPTEAEIRAFVDDPAPDDEALAKVVDRLLASSAFGERWGRHWLDVARYADSVGKTRNIPFPYAWRYRNYVIDAFNAGQPYDRFLAEQIAGDLLPSEGSADREAKLVATGLLALGSMDLNERDNDQFLLDRIDDQMDTLGRATMALTLGCARCHDHKFDPIAQTDYYALAGIFASTQTLSGQKHRQGGNKDYTDNRLLASLDGSMPLPRAEDVERLGELESRLAALREKSLKDGVPENRRRDLKAEASKIRAEIATLQDTPAASSSGSKKKSKKDGDRQAIDLGAPLAMAACEGPVRDLALRVRGEPDIKGAVVPRGFPALFVNEVTPKLPAGASGRLELAQWLTSPEHPMTSRVMVNRIWSHLFGRGLVETVDNFGFSGAAPSHPELLDFLSSRFVEGGWSIKSMIRLLVLSRTYRLSVAYPQGNVAADEDNALFWRANLRRLEAEAIRDSLLASAGLLRVERPTGAPFDRSVGGDLGKVSKKGGSAPADVILKPIRSVYLPVFRSRLPGMFTVFDFAEPDQVNGQRNVTTVPTQALFFLNNPFVLKTASAYAARLIEDQDSTDANRIQRAYAEVLGRFPTAAEVDRALGFIGEGSGDDGVKEAWAAWVQALYSSAEFRYIP
jgi:hypothetical protein